MGILPFSMLASLWRSRKAPLVLLGQALLSVEMRCLVPHKRQSWTRGLCIHQSGERRVIHTTHPSHASSWHPLAKHTCVSDPLSIQSLGFLHESVPNRTKLAFSSQSCGCCCCCSFNAATAAALPCAEHSVLGCIRKAGLEGAL